VSKTDVVIEAGPKRTFASAVDWPGWARSARDEKGALEVLAAYRDRYSDAIRQQLGAAEFKVIQRLKGDANTDMGVPRAEAEIDAKPLTDEQLERQIAILKACWEAFDRTAKAAKGRSLKSGARGGGRDLQKIRAHVVEADGAYLIAVAGRVEPKDRKTFVEMLWARHRGELADAGPRGGRRWTARYAIRRAAWHALDHAWEIEDRLE
jgi:hypothetical protein